METRIATRLKIRLRIVSKIDKKFQQGFGLICGRSFRVDTFDISEAGIGFYSKYFLPKGLMLEIGMNGIPLGLKRVARMKAEVRHCEYSILRGYRCGVKFVDIPDSYRMAIAQFVSAHEK